MYILSLKRNVYEIICKVILIQGIPFYIIAVKIATMCALVCADSRSLCVLFGPKALVLNEARSSYNVDLKVLNKFVKMHHPGASIHSL